MRILGVKFKNINALRGEWEIRFDRPPLSDTGLFAIVGSNGSGKSSILDALTLALYGETPRLKNPESKIMSWQADDSYAEVTFSVSDGLYRSGWSVRRESPEAPQMWLASLNGEETLLEDRIIRVRNRIAELTGLDFKRFCSSILLAQGEFTAFLNALETERAEILEKIIGPEMVQEMEESIHTRARIEGERLFAIREDAAGFPLPDKARVDEVRQSHEQVQKELQDTDRILEDLRVVETWLERVEGLEAAERNADETLAEAESRYAQAQTEFERLERARLAMPLEESVGLLDTLEADAQAAQRQLRELEEAIPSRGVRIGELEEQLGQTRTKLEQVRKQLEDRGEELLNASLRDGEIAAENERFLDVVSRYEAMERSQKENLQQQADIENRIAEVENRRQKLERQLDEHTDDNNLETDIAAIDALLSRLAEIRRKVDEYQTQRANTLEAERHTAKELQRAEGAVQKVRQKTDQLGMRKAQRDRQLGELTGPGTFESLVADLCDRKKKLAACKKLVKVGRAYREQAVGGDARDTLAQIRSEQDSLKQALSVEQALLKELEDQIRRRDAIRKYDHDRLILTPGDPCPLCGAPDHPFAEQGLPDFTELDRTVQDREQKILGLHKELNALNGRAVELQAQAQALDRIQQEWTRTSAQAGGRWSITEGVYSIPDEIRVLEGEIKLFKSRIRSARWQRWWAAWVGSSLERKLEKLSGKEQKRDIVRDTHESQQKTLAHLDSEIRRLEEKEESLRAELDARFLHCGESSLKPGMESDQLQRIRRRFEAYVRHSQERDALAEQLRSLEERKKALPIELERLREQSENLEVETGDAQARLFALKTERESLYGTMDPVRERQALESEMDLLASEEAALIGELNALRQTLAEEQNRLPQSRDLAQKTQAAFAEARGKLLEEITATGFGSLDEVREQLSILEEEQTIIEQHCTAEQSLTEAGSQSAAARDALESARSERQTDDSSETIRGKIAQRMEQREILQQRLDEVEQILSKHRDADREYRELLQAIAVQEKICAEVAADESLLQSQDAAETEKKLQRLLLDRLVEQSNQHLAKLTGRYTLRPLADNGLTLQIEDSLQGKIHRSVKTLSGGESFLVSLCLALGLSDMAGRHRKIESLFLDEGFGALDNETLYTVLAALKGLRANGRTVGVVSHVKRLADEIPTQIRVEKESDGFSRIAVVA